jgi:hypothetical protein
MLSMGLCKFPERLVGQPTRAVEVRRYAAQLLRGLNRPREMLDGRAWCIQAARQLA